MTHLWGSYDNIHKFIRDLPKSKKYANNINSFFDINVFITEKMDGSNLGIHIKKDETEWKIIKLQGRNAPIWNYGDDKAINNLSYGNAKALENLPNEMYQFAKCVAEKLGVNEIIIYGEAFKTENQKFASWHPFGYKILENDLELQKLTSKTYQLFVESSKFPAFTLHHETFDFLKNQKTHVVFPPPMLFAGKLGDAIETLFPMMEAAILWKDFEGTFIISENSNWDFGLKWKTGEFEEQLSIPSSNELTFLNEKSTNIYKKLEHIFHLKSKIEKPKKSEPTEEAINEKKLETELIKKVGIAVDRELSKIPSVENIPKEKRITIVENLIPNVADEVIKQYTDCELAVPWSREMIEKKAKIIMCAKIMKM